MKLKYYLRGMGIGIILTAIVMGFALGGRKKTISDAEVIERAKALGMIEASSGVLSDIQQEGEDSSNGENDKTSSDTSLGEEGKEVSEEVNEEVTGADQSDNNLDQKAEEGEGQDRSQEDGQSSQTGQEESGEVVQAIETKVEDTKTEETQTEETKTEETKTEETAENTETKNEGADNSESDLATGDETPAPQDTGFSTASTKTVTIPGGLSSDSVAAILYKEGIIDNAINFNRYLIDRKLDRVIRSGTKTFPEGATYEDIANIICKP